MADSPDRAAEHTEVVISRLRDKEKEVNLEANPDYPVSKFHCKLDKDAPSFQMAPLHFRAIQRKLIQVFSP